MKRIGRSQHDATGDHDERNRHPGDQIPTSQSAERLVPTASKHRVRQQECHVDSNRRGSGTEHDLPLAINELFFPKRIGGAFEPVHHFGQTGCWIPPLVKIWNEAEQRLLPIDLVILSQKDDGEDKANHDRTDNCLEQQVKHLCRPTWLEAHADDDESHHRDDRRESDLCLVLG